jgi:hypothetical protein
MPITAQTLLEQTGRENGPDFVLKVVINPIVAAANAPITTTSNITEVLNVIAYLCNPTVLNGVQGRDDTAIDTNQSVGPIIGGNPVGLHVAATGAYNAADGAGASNNTLWADDNGAATTQMIDLDTLLTPAAAAYTANHIPVGILARTPVPGALGTTNAAPPAIGAGAAGIPIPADIQPIFSNAIKQMINILENTRTIFGPKGWTALFNKVKGGGGGAKRTHRQHRRRYSSKHY